MPDLGAMFIARPRASCGNRSSGAGQNQGPIRRPAWRDRPGSAAENPAPLPAAFAVAGQIADPASVTAHSPLVETSGLPVALPRNFEALGATKSDRAPSAAATLLQHADANVRAVAGCARATIGGWRSALAAIRPLPADSRPDVRKAAIVSAGWLKDERTHLETPRTFRPEGFSPDITFALAKATDPSALDVFRDGRGGREPFLREPSRRAIAAIEAQTLASMAERHRAPPFTGPALAQLQRAGGKDDRALKGSLFEGDSPPVTLATMRNSAPGTAESRARAARFLTPPPAPPALASKGAAVRSVRISRRWRRRRTALVRTSRCSIPRSGFSVATRPRRSG